MSAIPMSFEVDLDPAAFWAEEKACRDRDFSTDKPRCAIGLPVDDHWLLEEMQPPSTVRYYDDPAYRAELNRQCNDRCEPAIGLRPFREAVDTDAPLLRIEEVFGSRMEVVEGGTPWLEPGITSIEQLRAKLDEVERLSDAELLALIKSKGGKIAPASPAADGSPRRVVGHSRGPATIATSVMGTTEAMLWLVDYPADMDRFFDLLGHTMIRYHQIIASEAGHTLRGYGVNDDNCALCSPAMYERFCFPMLQHVFATLAPDDDDWRFQHSDSDMAHLLPLLAKYRLTACNLGPNLTVQEIRAAMPRTMIYGEIAPMTLRNGSAEEIIAEVQRDFAGAGADGGLQIHTAGSVSAGTSLERIRLLMWAVQTYCRYD